MEITPALGLGDLIIWKLYEINNNKHIVKVNINQQIIHDCREQYENGKRFIDYIISKLFPDSEKAYISSSNHRDYPAIEANLKKFDLYEFFKSPIPIEMPSTKYIAIHTKARYHKFDEFRSLIPEIKRVFSSFKCAYPIMILGERFVSNNLEVRTWNIISLYDLLIETLSVNNAIIDNSKSMLCEGVDPNEFEKDIELVHGAECNFTFGIGGNFSISLVNAKKTCGLVINEEFNNYIKSMEDFECLILAKNVNVFFDQLNLYHLAAAST